MYVYRLIYCTNWFYNVYRNSHLTTKEHVSRSRSSHPTSLSSQSILSHHPVQESLFAATLKSIQSMLNECLLYALQLMKQTNGPHTPTHFLREKLGSYDGKQDIHPIDATSTGTNLRRFIQQNIQYTKPIWAQWRLLYLTHLRDQIPRKFPNEYRTSQYEPWLGDIVYALDH